MSKIRQPQPRYRTFREFRKTVDNRNFIAGLMLFVLAALILVFIAGIWLGHNQVASDTAADQHYTQVFNQQPDRQAFAQELLLAHEHRLLGAQDIFDRNPDYLKQLQHVAATGDKFGLPPLHPGPSSIMWTIAAFLFGGWAFAVSTFFGAFYLAHAADNRHYFADLPWHRAWTWVYVALSPVLWLPLLVSRNNIRRADRQWLSSAKTVL